METTKMVAQAVRKNREVRMPGNQNARAPRRKYFYSRKHRFNLTLTNTDHTIHLAKLVWEPQALISRFHTPWALCVNVVRTDNPGVPNNSTKRR